MRGLYIGRFQPFHFGHLEVIKLILEQVDELILVIGSAQESHSAKNPFTAGERFEMIRATLKNEKIDLSRIYIVPVEDVKRNSIWVAHIKTLVPKFDVIYTNEPLVTQLFTEAKYNVIKPPLFSRSEFSSTNVREAILSGREWEKLVPEPTKRIINSIGGVERIIKINSSDKE